MAHTSDESKKLESEAHDLQEQVKTLRIVDSISYRDAAMVFVAIKRLRKKIAETFDPIIISARATLNEALAQKREADAPLIEDEGVVGPALSEWNAKQEQIRKKEETRREEAARKQEEKRQLKRAMALEKKGDRDGAAAVLAEPIQTPAVIIPRTVPIIQGLIFTPNWTFHISNEAELPRQYLTPDLGKIGERVRSMKSATRIPGVKAYQERKISRRA